MTLRETVADVLYGHRWVTTTITGKTVCGCGERFYYSDHSVHVGEVLMEAVGLFETDGADVDTITITLEVEVGK